MMLSTEQKRQIFIKLRKENYQVSLRLEGLQSTPPKKSVAVTLAELKTKHVR